MQTATHKLSLADDLARGKVAISARDGRTYRLRPIAPSDAESLARGYAAMSSEAKLSRMLYKVPELTPKMAASFCSPDPENEYCVVVEGRDELVGEVLGGARLVRSGKSNKTAQFTVSLRPEAHGKGLAREAVQTLLGVAREMGVETVWGLITSDNAPMIALARKLGFSIQPNPEDPTEVLARIELPKPIKP